MLNAEAVRHQLSSEEESVGMRIVNCAERVARDWATTPTGQPVAADRSAVVPPMETALERADVLGELPTTLAACVTAAGGTLDATPVAAPPYVTITSTGPVLRATIGEERLVIRFAVFDVQEGRYVRRGTELDEIVEVDVI